jgi:hypothetical protein
MESSLDMGKTLRIKAIVSKSRPSAIVPHEIAVTFGHLKEKR